MPAIFIASKMHARRRFLVIDSFEEMRLLVVRTLRRVFPQAEIIEAHDFEEALSLVATEHYDAIVVHRAIGADAPTTIRCIRQHTTMVPIVSVSSIDRTDAVLAAGANVFLNFEEWLRVGTVVADLLARTLENRTRMAEPRV
jgi:hypothetical protein